MSATNLSGSSIASGSSMSFQLYLDTSKLHAGTNTAVVTVSGIVGRLVRVAADPYLRREKPREVLSAEVHARAEPPAGTAKRGRFLTTLFR